MRNRKSRGSTGCAQVVRAIVGLALLVAAWVAYGRETPKVSESEDALTKLASGPAFSCSGLSFYRSKLYAGSAAGLLEIDEGQLKKLYAWDKGCPGVGSLWKDTAHELLWVELADRLA